MKSLRKKIFLGMGIICMAFVVSMAGIDLKLDKTYSGLQMDNIEAYASDSEGGAWKCYGPKVDDRCQCTNTVECRDLYGCNR